MSQAQGTYVYVVSSSSNDHFAEMAAVSMASLRYCEANARIVAVIDNCSDYTPGISAIEVLADDVVKVSSAESDATFRSRSMKTSLRNIVVGDFLYLDCDTFILRPLCSIWDIKDDIAAAPDIGITGKTYTLTENQKAEFAKLGWNMPRERFLNSGVVFMKDNLQVRDFAKLLCEEWRHFCTKLGRYNDQPAFNYSVRMREAFSNSLGEKLKLKTLSTAWNAQISMNSALGHRANIVHLFSGGFEASNETVLHVVAKHLKQTGEIDNARIKRAVDAGHVWIALDRPRKLYAARRYVSALTAAFSR